jgi:predicted nuclease of predicted toxin-antitoxin system
VSRYLLDENLPASLASILGGDCASAGKLGARLTDDELWHTARREHRIICTKDADFFDKLLLHGPPPKVVWFRVGNLRLGDLENLVAARWREVERLLNDHDLIELHPTKIEGLKIGSA